MEYNTLLVKLNLFNIRENYNAVKFFKPELLDMDSADLKETLQREDVFTYLDYIDWDMVDCEELKKEIEDTE